MVQDAFSCSERQRTADSLTWLDPTSRSAAEHLLSGQGLLEPEESVTRLEVAGEGNMNVTLRVELSIPRSTGCDESPHQRSVILKQSRPFVARYASIPAPLERTAYEAAFYEFAGSHPQLADSMPRLLGWVPSQFVLVLEDLHAAKDATFLYAEQPASPPQFIFGLLDWLHKLHRASRGLVSRRQFRNRKLRELNHAHIFEIPFLEPAAVDLDAVCPGLTKATLRIRSSPELKQKLSRLGRLYLSDGDTLLHGDFYPGSWMVDSAQAKVIDPEFCYAGRAEFDWGILAAHLAMMGCSDGMDLVAVSVRDHQPDLDIQLIRAFSAAEVLRRLLGVAQLPLSIDLSHRMALIEEACRMLGD